MDVRFLSVAAILSLTVAGSVSAQCDDAFDKVLCVSTLTDQQAAQFSSTDRAVSAFWADWAGKDIADMSYPASCMPGRCNFTGADDAGLVVKAGATKKGIYILIEVTDNTWVDRAAADDIGADATDLFFDRNSSDFLGSCTDCMVGLYGSMLSYTTNQFQVWMGNSNPPTGFNFQRYDETAWSWQATGYTWDAARVLLGFEVEVINVDATHKTQEWYFPWDKFGSLGVAPGTNISGTKLGFAGGYNDKDGDNPEMDCLRWTLKDPWVPQTEGNFWGDLLIGSDLPPVESGMAVHKQASMARATALARATATYNLRGQIISKASTASIANGIAVRAGIDGRAVSHVVR